MGGGGEQTVGYRYYLGIHMVACMGPVDYLVGVKVDNKVAWSGIVANGTIFVDQPNLFGGDSSEGGVSGLIDVLPGGPTQGVNSYLAAQLQDPLVPSFRGVTSFVLNQCYLGNNPYLKAWSWRLQRIHTRQDGIAQWYDAKAEIASSFDGQTGTLLVADTAIPSVGAELAPLGPHDIVINNLSTTDVIVCTLLGTDGIYPAGSADPTGPTWGASFTVSAINEDGSYSSVGSFQNIGGLYATEELAGAALKGQQFTFTGHTDYVIWVQFGGDPTTTRGGVSMSVALKSAVKDINPAHILRECLTDPDWGMGYSEDDMDDVAFQDAADTLYTEGLGISLLWDTQSDIQDFITTVLTHIDAVLFVDRTTGLFVLRLIRNDYVLADILELTEDDIDYVQDFHRPQFGELTTAVTVQFWDSIRNTQGTVTIQDIALETAQNAAIGTTVQYPGLTNAQIATIIAQRDLRTLSSQLATGTVYAGRKAKVLQMGDVFKMTWSDYELSSVVMRVLGVGYGDGASNQIRLTVTEDVFSTDTATFVSAPTAPTWQNPSGPPQVPPRQVVFEMPYLELVQQQTQLTTDNALASDPLLGIVGVAVGRPSQGSINADIYSDAGAGYTDNATADFCPTAVLVDPIDLMQTSFAISGEDELDLVTIGTWVQIDSELMEVTSLTNTLCTVNRSCLDTLPALHTPGAILYFWDKFPSADPTQYDAGETINVKLTPKTGQGTLDLSKATVKTILLANRAIRPYPPANLKINSQYYPAQIEGDMVLTWAHRDRTQQTGGDLLSFTDASVGPETGTTYTLKVYNVSNTLVRTVSGITSNTTTYTGTMELADGGPFSAFRFTLAAERAGYESWQIYNISLTRPAPIPAVGVFLPATALASRNPHLIDWHHGYFIVGIEGTQDTNDTIGYYRIKDDMSASPEFIGSAYQIRDDGAGHNFYRPYNGTALEMNIPYGVPISAAGVDSKLAFFYSRRDPSLTPNHRWLVTYDDSTMLMNLVDTVSGINTDIMQFFKDTDGTTYAWSFDTTAAQPVRSWKSTDEGGVWSFIGQCTGWTTDAGGISILPGQSTLWKISSKFIRISGTGTAQSTDGLAWTAGGTIDSGFAASKFLDYSYDGTALVVLGQRVPALTYDGIVLGDGALCYIDWIGSSGGANIFGNKVSGPYYGFRSVPNGVGVPGWGLNAKDGLDVAPNAVQAGSIIISTGSLGAQCIETVGGSYLELRDGGTNAAHNFLQGTSNFSIECWLKVTSGTDQPSSGQECVIFSQCATGSPQFQNVLLTFKPVTNALRFRTIRQTGPSTYVADVDIQITTAFDIVNTPDFTSTHLVITRGASGKIRVYVNGTDIGGQASGTTTDLTVTGTNQLGCVWGNTNSRINCMSGAATPSFGMQFDGLCLYGAELTSTQVGAHYTAGRTDGLTHNCVWRSTDGLTFTKTRDVLLASDFNSAGSGFYIGWTFVKPFNGGFALYGREPFSGAFPHVCFSTDHGSTWDSTNTAVITDDTTSNAQLLQLRSLSSLVFADVSGCTAFPYPKFAYSSDGITFTDYTTDFPTGSIGVNLIVLDDTAEPRAAETGEIRIEEN